MHDNTWYLTPRKLDYKTQLILPVITIIPAIEHSITMTTILSVSVKRYPTV